MDESIHRERVYKAVRYEQPDRTPFVFSDSVIGRFGDPSYGQGDNYLRPEWAMDQLIKGALALDTDSNPGFEYSAGTNLTMEDGVHFLMPGRDCASNLGTQAVENNYMTDTSHYDIILEKGWRYYQENYVSSHKTAQDEEDFNRLMELSEIFAGKLAEAGIDRFDIFTDGAMLECGTYMFTMLRGFGPFLMDCRKIPDKVIETAAVVRKDLVEAYKEMSAEMDAKMLLASICRTDAKTMRRKDFEKIIWPEIAEYQKLADEEGKILELHIDGDYTAYKDLFCDLTPERTILQFDGFTDTFALADGLTKNKICVWGDVHPLMLTGGTPEDVYAHCMKLKELYGAGVILHAGCSYPPQSKLENLLAMKRAADKMDF